MAVAAALGVDISTLGTDVTGLTARIPTIGGTANQVWAKGPMNEDPDWRDQMGGTSMGGEDPDPSAGGGGFSVLGTHTFATVPAEDVWIDTGIDISSVTAGSVLGWNYPVGYATITDDYVRLFAPRNLATSSVTPNSTAPFGLGDDTGGIAIFETPFGAGDAIRFAKTTTGTLAISFEEDSSFELGTFTLYSFGTPST